MNSIERILEVLQHWSQILPLELFVFIASFVEEIVAPIPSPFVMTSAGGLAEAAGRTFFGLIVISIFGAIGKTIGAWVLYIFADRAEDLVSHSRVGAFLGLDHHVFENLATRLTAGKRDWWALFIIRSLPVVPSSPVSLACGLLRIPLRSYLFATLFGVMVRNMFFLIFGYYSVASLQSITSGIASVETAFEIAFVIAFGGVIAWAYYRRHLAKKKG